MNFFRWLFNPKAVAQERIENALTRAALDIDPVSRDLEVERILHDIWLEIKELPTPYQNIVIEISVSFNQSVYKLERLNGRQANHILRGEYQIFGCDVRTNADTNQLIEGTWRIVIDAQDKAR